MTATVTSAMRYGRRKSKRSSKCDWKLAAVWYCALAIGAFFALNWIYQAIRKPGEVLAPVSAPLAKSPESTWRNYGPIFEQYSTNIISPEFLAALAQVEGSGNPIAHTYWRWQWSWNPFEIYRPASSALGMFQITDGTFAEARKYCIHNHEVVADGPWYDLRSCWFKDLYIRTLPSHATELTAAYLHRNVVNALAAHPGVKAKPAQKQKLAAVIHLCGPGKAETFVARGFRALPSEHCGTHSLRAYLSQVDLMMKQFARLRERNGL